MAEMIGEPTEFAEIKRRRYPWDKWAAEPFVQWMIFPGIDYDGDPRKMDATIRTYAGRHGIDVVINAADPEGKGRIVFCFSEKGKPRPNLRNYEQFGNPSAVTPEAAEVTITDDGAIECVVCHAVQERPPHLVHVRECLIRNPNDPRDLRALYARHREDTTAGNTAGLRRVNQFSVTWSEETGPVS